MYRRLLQIAVAFFAAVALHGVECVAQEVSVADGIYPVFQSGALADADKSTVKVLVLECIPVKGAKSSTTRIRILPRPLLRLQEVSQLAFTVKDDECTQVSFQNTRELKAYTREHVGSRLAIVIGGKVVTHHKIREPIESANVRITFCTEGGGDHLKNYLSVAQ